MKNIGGIIMEFIFTLLLTMIVMIHMTLHAVIDQIFMGTIKSRLAIVMGGAAALIITLRYPSAAHVGFCILLGIGFIICLLLTLDYQSWRGDKMPALTVPDNRKEDTVKANHFINMDQNKAKLEYERITDEITDEDGGLDLKRVGEVAREYSKLLNYKRKLMNGKK